MFDLEKIDELFEACPQMSFSIFDKHVLLPLSQLPQAIARETRETMSEAELRTRAGEGWFPLLSGAGETGNEEGSPLYVPSRVGMLLGLQRKGYAPDETRLIARSEEWMIDELLTVDELAYVDDDLQTLVLHTRARIESIETSIASDVDRQSAATELEQDKRHLRFLMTCQARGIPSDRRNMITKAAFRVRAINDLIRVQLLDTERAKITAGYSPFVVFSSYSWRREQGFEGGPILWKHTVQAALANVDPIDIVPIRIPGFLLQGDRVIPTRTLRPSEYTDQWREYGLDEYLQWWAELRGERRCLNCFTPLSGEVDERKRFCDEKCRNAAKQRRYRERNPEAVAQAQQRYWQSL